MIPYKRSNLLRADFVIMRILYESVSGLQPYTILQRSKLSGEIFLKAYSALAAKNLVVDHNSLIYLSELGREVFLAGSGMVLSGKKHWRDVPERMRGRTIAVDSFYIPNVFLLNQ
ncbi:hypothetical protein ACKUG4_08485 [Pseudomonas glycinae]|uniref:hypothetical protein n=1 Tax=Candidatus Pseudomonas auctus TaxID=3461260 RepID=UPI003B90588D